MACNLELCFGDTLLEMGACSISLDGMRHFCTEDLWSTTPLCSPRCSKPGGRHSEAFWQKIRSDSCSSHSVVAFEMSSVARQCQWMQKTIMKNSFRTFKDS